VVCGIIAIFTVLVTVKFSFEVKSFFSDSFSLSSNTETVIILFFF